MRVQLVLLLSIAAWSGCGGPSPSARPTSVGESGPTEVVNPALCSAPEIDGVSALRSVGGQLLRLRRRQRNRHPQRHLLRGFVLRGLLGSGADQSGCHAHVLARRRHRRLVRISRPDLPSRRLQSGDGSLLGCARALGRGSLSRSVLGNTHCVSAAQSAHQPNGP
jgi:hypothetical protein